MLTVTFVRHGESVDNLKSIWAGWKDGELSVHGNNQARAVGEYFSSVPITAIYASPLKRAHHTALQIFNHQPEPKPPLTTSLLLREQYWGVAEGQSFLTSSDTKADSYAPLQDRTARFPEGEWAEDVASRVDAFIDEFLLSHIKDSKGKTIENGPHIFVVSHGLAIAEAIGAFLRRDPSASSKSETWRGLHNTAWTRLVVGLQEEKEGNDVTRPSGKWAAGLGTEASERDPAHIVATAEKPAHPPESATWIDRPRLTINITHVNQSSHLANVKRQKGGIGSSTYDPNQTSIKDFFGGGVSKF